MVQRNLRQHVREKSQISARIELGDKEIAGTIENIGEGGAFFVTDDLEGSVEEGMSVVLQFSEQEVVRLTGTVLRTERYFHGGEVLRALAVKFDEPHER